MPRLGARNPVKNILPLFLAEEAVCLARLGFWGRGSGEWAVGWGLGSGVLVGQVGRVWWLGFVFGDW